MLLAYLMFMTSWDDRCKAIMQLFVCKYIKEIYILLAWPVENVLKLHSSFESTFFLSKNPCNFFLREREKIAARKIIHETPQKNSRT